MRITIVFAALSLVTAYGAFTIETCAPALLAEIVCLLSAGIAAQAVAFERRQLGRGARS